MHAIGWVVGASALLAAGAIGIAVATSGDDSVAKESSGSGGSSGAGSKTPGDVGVRWDYDALLPSVHQGGARQAEWAAAAVGNLDYDGNDQLDIADATAKGSWNTRAATHVIGALVERYDASGDGSLDAKEQSSVGEDVASNGWLTAAAVKELRGDLGG